MKSERKGMCTLHYSQLCPTAPDSMIWVIEPSSMRRQEYWRAAILFQMIFTQDRNLGFCIAGRFLYCLKLPGQFYMESKRERQDENLVAAQYRQWHRENRLYGHSRGLGAERREWTNGESSRGKDTLPHHTICKMASGNLLC